jgi:hypothetical protein
LRGRGCESRLPVADGHAAMYRKDSSPQTSEPELPACSKTGRPLQNRDERRASAMRDAAMRAIGTNKKYANATRPDRKATTAPSWQAIATAATGQTLLFSRNHSNPRARTVPVRTIGGLRLARPTVAQTKQPADKGHPKIRSCQNALSTVSLPKSAWQNSRSDLQAGRIGGAEAPPSECFATHFKRYPSNLSCPASYHW